MTRQQFAQTDAGQRMTQEELAHVHEISVDGLGVMTDYDCSGNACNRDGTDTVYCRICNTYFTMPCVLTLEENK